MSTFRLEPNGVIYLYHWVTPKRPFKISTGLKIEPSKWNKEKMRPKSSTYVFKGINVTQELIKMEAAFLDAWNYFKDNGGFSSIKLKQKFKDNLSAEPGSNIKNSKPRFLEYFAQVLEEYKITKSRNSWKGYNTSLNHLKKYFGRTIPNFEDIDIAFYHNYNNYLLELDLSLNTISSNWKFIKAVMKRAHQHRLHSNTDYLMFKRHNENSDSVFLTEAELQKIFDLELAGYLDKARNYFLIGCYTGLRYEDWDKVSMPKIKDGLLYIIPKKTKNKVTIPVANNLIRILQKYPEGVLPAKPSNQKLNDYIKKVAEKAEINEIDEKRITVGGKLKIESKPKFKLVSTHTARRSFATIMILNGVQPHLIMKITGHRTLSSFERYIRFDELQASIQLKESASFKKSFGKALTWNEKMQSDATFKKEKTKLLL